MRRSFRLSGPSIRFDPRRNALRGDLADVALAGQKFVPHYAEAILQVCALPFSAMFDKPGGTQTSELLLGEGFAMLEIAAGWAWGYSVHDHYVGYVRADILTAPVQSTTSAINGDPVSTAAQFLNMPYLWGGRGGAGIDCSGLVQRGLAAAGIAAPRDSDMQLAELGNIIPENSALQRGDLIFFPGHVGMMSDDINLLHATRHHGKTVIEALSAVIARVTLNHAQPVIARKRILM